MNMGNEKQKLVVLFISFPSSILTVRDLSYVQQMDPAKQAKVMQEFQRQSAQMDMTVRLCILFLNVLWNVDQAHFLSCIVV